jgi:hypothetical protein
MKTSKGTAVPSIPEDRESGTHVSEEKERCFNDPRRLYNWESQAELGANLREQIGELRKFTMGMWAAARGGDRELTDAHFAEIEDVLDRAEECAKDVAFIARRHLKFIIENPEEMPVEAEACAEHRRKAEKARVTQ